VIPVSEIRPEDTGGETPSVEVRIYHRGRLIASELCESEADAAAVVARWQEEAEGIQFEVADISASAREPSMPAMSIRPSSTPATTNIGRGEAGHFGVALELTSTSIGRHDDWSSPNGVWPDRDDACEVNDRGRRRRRDRRRRFRWSGARPRGDGAGRDPSARLA
jgi:hypothetical protein